MEQQPEALRLAEDAIECWRINYSLDKSPQELADMWACGAPFGAVLALKASTDELRRLYADNERKSEAIQKLWKERDEAIAENQRLRSNRAHANAGSFMNLAPGAWMNGQQPSDDGVPFLGGSKKEQQ